MGTCGSGFEKKRGSFCWGKGNAFEIQPWHQALQPRCGLVAQPEPHGDKPERRVRLRAHGGSAHRAPRGCQGTGTHRRGARPGLPQPGTRTAAARERRCGARRGRRPTQWAQVHRAAEGARRPRPRRVAAPAPKRDAGTGPSPGAYLLSAAWRAPSPSDLPTGRGGKTAARNGRRPKSGGCPPPLPPRRPPGSNRSRCRRERRRCLCYASRGRSALLGSAGGSCFAFLLLLPVAVICISPALIEMRLFTPASPRRSLRRAAPPLSPPLFRPLRALSALGAAGRPPAPPPAARPAHGRWVPRRQPGARRRCRPGTVGCAPSGVPLR